MRRFIPFFMIAIVLVVAVAVALRQSKPSEDNFAIGLPTHGQWRNGFDVADMNGDGALDIVFGPARKGSQVPSIFLGDGHGHFRRWHEAKFPPLPYDYGAAVVADFNGDTLPDIGFGVHLRGLAVIAGVGGGAFEAYNEGIPLSSKGEVFSSRAVAAGDLDGDGTPELVALSDGPRPYAGEAQTGIAVYKRTPDQTAWQRTGNGDADRVFGDQLALADVDGDKKLDLLLGTSSLGARTILRLGNGDGTFRDAALDVRPASIFRSAAVVSDHSFAASFSTNVGGAWTTGVDLFVREGDSFVRKELFADAALNEVFALAAGDFDGDGAVDLAAARNDGSVTLLLGDRFVRSTLAVPQQLGGCRAYGLRFADLDQDRKAELIAGYAGESEGKGKLGLRCETGGGIYVWKRSH